MDMDLVVVFGFVITVVLVITAGIVLFPITRRLGGFLEDAARQRAERLASQVADPPVGEVGADETSERLVELLSDIQDQVSELAERQAFTERLLETRDDRPEGSR